MPTYLDRYLAGEHEAVWRELQVLGPAVRDEPIYSDAVAVAQETMLRARQNIETLVERLTALDYRFAEGVDYLNWEGPASSPPKPMWHRRLHSYPGTPHPATPFQPSESIAALEAKAGTLPISLRAFYEIVGFVDLCGHFPFEEWPVLDLPEGFEDEDDGPIPNTLDPLQVFAAEKVRPYTRSDGRITISICHDNYLKMNYSAVGDMEIVVPCQTMDAFVWLDAPFEDDSLLFVNCLRRAFQYGGFNHITAPDPDYPGFVRTVALLQAMRTPDGMFYLEYLTRGLLPI